MSGSHLPDGSTVLPDGSLGVLLSADTDELLRAEASAVLGYLRRHEGACPAAVAATLCATRTPRRRRALIRATTREDLIAGLTAVVDQAEHPAVEIATAIRAPKVAFVFPGQGNQRPGMGRLYYERSAAFRAEVDRCEEAFGELFGISPRAYLLAEEDVFGNRTEIVQPALFMQMAGLAAMWQGASVAPSVTVGHSQGEIAAAYVAGAMTLRDAVRVVTIRSQLMEKLSPEGYSMAVLGLTRDECEDLLSRHSGWAEVSVVNSTHLVAVSGDVQTVEDLVARVDADGKFARQLRVPYPAHTSIVSRYREAHDGGLSGQLEHAAFLESPVQCVGSATRGLIGPQFQHGEYWYWNLRNRVRFDLAVAKAVELGAQVFVEIAEHPTLVAPMLETLFEVAPKDTPRLVGTSRRTAQDLGEFTKNLAAVAVRDLGFRWPQRSDAERPLRGFPGAPMGAQRFWIQNEPAAARRLAAPVEEGEQEASKPRILRERWELCGVSPSARLREILVVDPTKQCAELVGQVCAAADRDGVVASVFGGDFEAVRAEVDVVLLLFPELEECDARVSVEMLAQFCEAHGRLPGGDGSSRRYLLVTTGAERARDEDPSPNLFLASVAAAVRSISYEHPAHRFAHLDFEAGFAARRAGSAAEQVLQVARIESEPELAVRDGALLVKRWSPVSEPGGAPPDLSHVVVFGGTGSFGMELCERLCAEGARAVTLVSRSGKAAVDPGALRQLKTRFGSVIDVLSCDVADAAAVSQLAAEQRAPASLILHAAVAHVHAPMAALRRELVERACLAKVVGAEHVLNHWPRTTTGRVVLFSSVMAALGGHGQVGYAAANRMLDALADKRRAEGVDCVSVQWGTWRASKPVHVDGLGEVSSEVLLAGVEEVGLIGMDPPDAVGAMLRGHGGNVAVVSADWPRMSAFLGGFGRSALLGELTGADAADRDPALAQAPDFPSLAEPPGVLSDRIRFAVAEVMGVGDDVSAIDGSMPLVALGLDSLQALELRKRIRAAVSRDLPLQQIMAGASLDDVVVLLTGQNVEVHA